jgi:hypothetical protein
VLGGIEEFPGLREISRSSRAIRSASSVICARSCAFSAFSCAFCARSAAATSAAPGVSGTPVLHQSRPSVAAQHGKPARKMLNAA